MTDTYMPDQISVRLITAKGSEEERWDIFWLTPIAELDPLPNNNLSNCKYLAKLLDFMPWLINYHVYFHWDEFNVYGQLRNVVNDKPILELVGENVG